MRGHYISANFMFHANYMTPLKQCKLCLLQNLPHLWTERKWKYSDQPSVHGHFPFHKNHKWSTTIWVLLNDYKGKMSFPKYLFISMFWGPNQVTATPPKWWQPLLWEIPGSEATGITEQWDMLKIWELCKSRRSYFKAKLEMQPFRERVNVLLGANRSQMSTLTNRKLTFLHIFILNGTKLSSIPPRSSDASQIVEVKLIKILNSNLIPRANN